MFHLLFPPSIELVISALFMYLVVLLVLFCIYLFISLITSCHNTFKIVFYFLKQIKINVCYVLASDICDIFDLCGSYLFLVASFFVQIVLFDSRFMFHRIFPVKAWG